MLAFLGFGTLSAQERDSQSQSKDSVKKPLLKDLRKRNAAKFKEARQRIRTQPKAQTTYRFQRCTPCDTRYVAQLLKKDSLSKVEIRNLICTNQPKCRTNAEYREIFNELVHKSIDRIPDRFFDTYQEKGQRKFLNELDEEILNPIDDRYTAESALQKVRARMKIKTNNQIDPITLRRLQGKLERKIQVRRTELIKRNATIKQGGD